MPEANTRKRGRKKIQEPRKRGHIPSLPSCYLVIPRQSSGGWGMNSAGRTKPNVLGWFEARYGAKKLGNQNTLNPDPPHGLQIGPNLEIFCIFSEGVGFQCLGVGTHEI